MAAFFPNETETVSIPRNQNLISTVAIGVLNSSARPELVEQFIEFVITKQGQVVFAKHHYAIAPPE